MMWHFYEIPYIPDLELVKYQSLGEQGIDGILERHNRFLRQWQRNTVLIHTTLHFFLSYTHERPKGSRLQIFLAFSSDQTVNFESIDALMQASPLADYYKIAPIEDVPVCLRKSFTNILLVKKQEQTRLSTGDTLFTVEGWKSNPKSRLYEMEKTAEALNEDMVYHISIYGSDTYKTAQQALQKPIAILREKALGRSGQITLADNKNRPRDVSAEETLRIYEEFLSDVAKSPCFFANILLYANQKSSAHFLMDAVCGEAIKEGTCEIQEIPSTATPLELQEVNQPYCNLLPPSLAFWPTAYTLDELSSFFRLPILFDGENIEIKKETAPKLEQTGIYLGQTNNGLSAFIDAYEGYGAQRIATYLNNAGYRARSGKCWHPGSLRGMVGNLTYMGVLRCGDARSELMPELQIIPQEEFEAAQRIREDRSAHAAEEAEHHVPLRTRGQALLSNNVYCGHCGARLALTTSRKWRKLSDGTLDDTLRIRYTCYGKLRKQTDCTGQTGYTMHILDEIIDKMVRQIFSRLRGIPKEQLITSRYAKETAERKNHLQTLQAERDKAEKDLLALKTEILAVIKGESAFPKDTLAEMIAAQEKKHTELETLCEEASAELERNAELMANVSQLYEELISYADLYDSASFEAKKMIVSQLIRRVEVYRGYQIHVDFNFDLAQYLENRDELAC